MLARIAVPQIPIMDLKSDQILGGEGFLFPGEYLFGRSATAGEIVQDFINMFIENVPPDIQIMAKNQQLTLREVVILASIVQKEMVLKEEAPLIASVFLNRLGAEMPLQSDPTVQYALGYSNKEETWWRTTITAEDLNTKSLFNTYIHKGLPPAPICNPGLDAILAVLQPAETNFLYFRAACDGSGQHVFSESYEAHLDQACNE